MRLSIGRCFAVLMLAAATASAGAVEGTVSWARSQRVPAPRVEDAVVWLESVPERTERQLTRPPFLWFWQRRVVPPLPRVVQAGRRYDPRVIALARGGSLVILNRDEVWHGTFSVSPAHRFELGKRPPGRADTVRFDRVGLVSLRCDIHPDMSAFVVITPNHAYAQPNAAGAWRLPELPAGRYVVRAWHPELGELRRAVNVPFRGTVNLPLRW